MKTNKFFFVIAALMTISISSCNKVEAPATDNSNGMIRLSSVISQTSPIAQTRSIDQSLQNTQFATGMTIGLFVTDNATTPAPLYTNRELASDGSGALAVKTNENMYYGSNDRVNLYAYYPYNAAAMLAAVLPFSVKADQSSDADYRSSDLMWGVPAANPVKRTTDVVNLGFAHKFSKVIVKLTVGAGSPDLKGATVNILNTQPSTTLDIKTGIISAASGTAVPVKMATFANNATTFDCSAVVVPQTFTATTRLIEVLLADGGKLYYEAPAGGITFESGKSYIYNVTVNLTGLIVTSKITDWTAGNGTGDNGNADMPDAE